MYDTILLLPGLLDGAEMSELDISQVLQLKIKDTRARLSTLVIQKKLTRTPGIASRPAMYTLSPRQVFPSINNRRPSQHVL